MKTQPFFSNYQCPLFTSLACAAAEALQKIFGSQFIMRAIDLHEGSTMNIKPDIAKVRRHSQGHSHGAAAGRHPSAASPEQPPPPSGTQLEIPNLYQRTHAAARPGGWWPSRGRITAHACMALHSSG